MRIRAIVAATAAASALAFAAAGTPQAAGSGSQHPHVSHAKSHARVTYNTAGRAILRSGYAAGPGGAEACPSGTVCLYYNSPQNGWGSWEDWSPNQSLDLSNYKFAHWANGSGYGQTVSNNAASIVNNTGHTVYVYTDTGIYDAVIPNYEGALTYTWNQDAYMNT